MTGSPAGRSGGRRARARRGLMAVYGALGVLAAATAVVIALALLLYFGPGPALPHGHPSTVVLRNGAGLQEIASDLKRAGVIGSDAVFIAAAEVTGAAHRLKAGEYAFPSRASLAQIVDQIVSGRVVRHFITIPEGATSQAVMETLMRAEFLTGVAPSPPEGAVLPETYEARRGDDRAAVLQRMMNARDRLLASLWAHRRADLPYRTPADAVTLASIVEKETAKPEERPRIAAVFLNRLRANMRLESDPTVIYGLTGGRPLGHGLKASELASLTPYNTYQVAGLPPTPICNPGRASLAAALDPPQTGDLYFVADGTGGHAFASTLQDHLANVSRWRSIETARNCAHPPGKPASC